MIESRCYKNSFLKQVIAKIDFANPINQIENNVPKKLLDVIVSNFPIVEPEEVIMQEVAVRLNEARHRQTTYKQWNYFGTDRSRQLTLSSQNIFVLYTTYNSYAETKTQFGKVIDTLNNVFPETLVSRFGLRYINEIVDIQIKDPTNWGEYIHQQLVGNRAFFTESETLSRLITIAELKYDDIGVRFQFGMPNPDYPAPIKRPVFILDIDASITQAHDLSAVLNNMDNAHKYIQIIFENSITDALREKMDVQQPI